MHITLGVLCGDFVVTPPQSASLVPQGISVSSSDFVALWERDTQGEGDRDIASGESQVRRRVWN